MKAPASNRHPAGGHFMQHSALKALAFLLPVALAVSGICCGGCSGSRDADHRLNLNRPVVSGREVSVNGGVVAPVRRIQWDWGDGQRDSHRFFPAAHTYEVPGTYTITVTVFDRQGRTSKKSVTAVVGQGK